MCAGLPIGRGDVLLGVIVHTRTKRLSLQPTHTSPVTRIKAEVTLKRRHSSADDKEGHERKKHKVEIGFGNQTPPLSSRHIAETKNETPQDDDADDSAPYSPSKMYESDEEAQSSNVGSMSTDVAESTKKEILHVSFYGEHQPADTDTLSPVKTAPPQLGGTAPDVTKLVDVNTTAVAASLKSALDLPQSANIQTLLSNLSSTKLKELASAVSTLEKISDGPIDQSTLAAAGTAKLRAAFRYSIYIVHT